MADEFDPEYIVNEYCRLLAQRDEQTNGPDRFTYQSQANRLKKLWWEWSGSEGLHEAAFGEPYDLESDR